MYLKNNKRKVKGNLEGKKKKVGWRCLRLRTGHVWWGHLTPGLMLDISDLFI